MEVVIPKVAIMKWWMPVNGIAVAIPRLAAKPIVAKPNMDCNERALHALRVGFYCVSMYM